MGRDLPLPALLSHALVAFTIELDNEFEREVMGGNPRPFFLTSLPMWADYLRHVGDGISTSDLAALAGVTKTNVKSRLNGLTRWGYVTVGHGQVVGLTPSGRRAVDISAPLPSVIEARWRDRFGSAEIDALREHLGKPLAPVETRLPWYLPVIGARMFSEVELTNEPNEAAESLPLFALLAQALLVFTLDYERDVKLALPMTANVVRILDATPTKLRDLPQLAGVSKEAISMVVNFLAKIEIAEVTSDPDAPRGKVVRLTEKGERARDGYARRQQSVERDWRSRHGDNEIDALTASLRAIVGDSELAHSPLAAGLVPPPGTWRASRRPPDALPEHPMVLHRGGFPDGA